MSATDDRIDRLTAIIGKGGLYDQMARILDSLDRSAKVALARELALAAAGYAVVPVEMPEKMDGIRQRIGITRDQYARIIASLQLAEQYDRAMLAAAAQEPEA
jgi:hypothetical protein